MWKLGLRAAQFLFGKYTAQHTLPGHRVTGYWVVGQFFFWHLFLGRCVTGLPVFEQLAIGLMYGHHHCVSLGLRTMGLRVSGQGDWPMTNWAFAHWVWALRLWVFWRWFIGHWANNRYPLVLWACLACMDNRTENGVVYWGTAWDSTILHSL
jgi:hypothetical protein